MTRFDESEKFPSQRTILGEEWYSQLKHAFGAEEFGMHFNTGMVMLDPKVFRCNNFVFTSAAHLNITAPKIVLDSCILVALEVISFEGASLECTRRSRLQAPKIVISYDMNPSWGNCHIDGSVIKPNGQVVSDIPDYEL